jgi:hypothetical protein
VKDAATMADPAPLALTDDQLSQVMAACQTLAPYDRAAFLPLLADRLREQPIGDGSVHRTIRELLRTGYFRLGPVPTAPSAA